MSLHCFSLMPDCPLRTSASSLRGPASVSVRQWEVGHTSGAAVVVEEHKRGSEERVVEVAEWVSKKFPEHIEGRPKVTSSVERRLAGGATAVGMAGSQHAPAIILRSSLL